MAISMMPGLRTASMIKKSEGLVPSNQDISKVMLELVQSDIHGVVQNELAELRECVPTKDERKKYFKKNVRAYYTALNETVGTEQKIKAGGYGNPTTKNLTINLNGLGMSDKQKLLAQMAKEMQEIGAKMGYAPKEEVVDIDAEVVPGNIGHNRLEDKGI